MVKIFKIFKNGKTIEIQPVMPTEVYMVEYKVRKIAKRVLKHHCYCPILLMRTTKTVVWFTNKCLLPSPIWVLIGVLAKFHE